MPYARTQHTQRTRAGNNRAKLYIIFGITMFSGKYYSTWRKNI